MQRNALKGGELRVRVLPLRFRGGRGADGSEQVTKCGVGMDALRPELGKIVRVQEPWARTLSKGVARLSGAVQDSCDLLMVAFHGVSALF